MNGSLNPRVKICCIGSIEEAKLAIGYGANDIGLVGPMPSGPGIIDNALIKTIASSIDSKTNSFLLTSETIAENIYKHHLKVNTNTIQIVDKVSTDVYAYLRKKCPTVQIVQVIHVMNENAIQKAKEVSTYVDFILLDSGNPQLEKKILGGTGKVHNWEISKRIRAALDIPVYLAGGLNAQNVSEAINVVQPFGIDLCSGVRTKGKLNPQKLKDFFNAVKKCSIS